MKIFSGKKDKKGFTLMEVMLVVAILVIVMGIAVPGIINLSKEMKIKKLDDIAREIYTSAQSQAVSLSVGGQLAQVGGMEVKDGETVKYKYVYKSGRIPTTIPDTKIDMLLPWGSIEEGVRQNYYIIEYNPATAMILGVYYWEDEGNGFATDGYGSVDPENKEERMARMVGYCNGADVEGRLSADGSDVKAGLVNDEELYLAIMQGVDGSEVAINGTITVTLTDLDTGVSKEIASFKNETIREDGSLVKKEDPFTEYSNISYYVKNVDGENSIPAHFKLTLDSLDPNLRFSKLYPEADGSFRPGCNLKVTVSFQETGKQVQEKSFFTNSLFASVEKSEDTGVVSAYISCGRHLQNLGLLWVYDGSEPPTIAAPLNGVTKAVQTANIDWEQSLDKAGITDPASPSFKPIVNEDLKEFDGGGNTISINISGNVKGDLLKGYTGADGFGIGLFSEFKGNSLKNINLVNCTVEDLAVNGANPLYVGLLAGRIDNTTGTCKITDCHAYATVDATSRISDCSITAPGNTDSAGGLFGFVQSTGGDVTMESCSASLTEITGNAKYVGGLVGRIDSNASAPVTISQCYADTGVWSSSTKTWESSMSGQNVGGLLGSITGSGSFTLENSYAVGGVVSTAETAYGLVGAGSGTPIIRNCYAALLKGNDIVDKLVPTSVFEAGISNSINYCGSYSGFDSLLDNSEDSYYVRGDEIAQTDATHPYGMAGMVEAGNGYPFPRLKGMLHYGDWPEKMKAVQMAYFEVYRDGTNNYSIGFYSKEPNQEIFNTLTDDETYTVVMDGYAVMFPVKDMPELTVKYNGTEVVTYPLDPLNPSNPLKLMNAKEKFVSTGIRNITEINSDTGTVIQMTGGKTKTYYPLFLSSAMMVEGETSGAANAGKNNLANHNSYYQRMEVGIKTNSGTELTDPLINVHFNPYVAKSDFVEVTAAGAAPTPPHVPDVSILRTSRQITAYTTFKAMQNTAIGDSNSPHTLRLERNIALTGNITTDLTITDANIIKCEDLSIPAGIKTVDGAEQATANVILELNGKTLTGTGNGSVVSSWGGQLTVYGYTAGNQGGTDSTPEGTIRGGSGTEITTGGNKKCGGGIYVKSGTFNMTGGIISSNRADAGSGIYMEKGTKGVLTDVTIKDNTVTNNIEDKSSIYMTGDITLDGSSIIDKE